MEAGNQNSPEEFINLGLISFSKEYTLAPDARYILFRIRNNTPRSISHIYAWIYKYRDLGRAGKKDYVLVNNPHQGGQVLKGPHAPGTVKEWRFSLRKDLPLPEKNEKFTLRVQPGAIFYHSLEPSDRSAPASPR